MQIPLNWINELVNIKKISLESFIEKLTLGGFEVEEIIETEIDNQKQITLDISATANRADSLSIQGFAREVATILNEPIQTSKYSENCTSWKNTIALEMEQITDLVPYSTFVAVSIENVTNFMSPKWIKQKLQSAGMTPLNTLEDFQNYILLETGYPFTVYDFKKVASELKTENFTLSIENVAKKQIFFATNENEYTLTNKILTVNANQLPISIAGIIEAKPFAIDEKTDKILIEASIFNGATIRQQSRTLGLRTEKSGRYEKSLRNTYLIEALYRLISLLKILNPNMICKLHTAKQRIEQPTEPIKLRSTALNQILGPIQTSQLKNKTYLNQKQIESYLTRLNFQFKFDESKKVWLVKIPHSRTKDISREIDLIEEIGRIHGFNNFLTILPNLQTVGKEDSTYKIRKKVTSCLLNLGFNELMNFSLVNKITFIENHITLVNPLLTDCAALRTSLLPSLIKTVQENLKQKNQTIEGFEYGHIFLSNENKGVIEKEYVSGVFGGINKKLSWTNPTQPLMWFEAKGKFEQLFNQLNIPIIWTKSKNQQSNSLLHPYRSADLYTTKNQYIGTFGQIHPILGDKLNILLETYLFELDLEIIELNFKENKLPIYKTYSMYPKIIKDLSFIIKKNIEFGEIKRVLYWNGTDLLVDIKLLDEYMGKAIPDDSTSLCLQLIFQSEIETLETKKIDNILKHLEQILTERFNAHIRN